VDRRHLEYFLAVAQSGSFTGAARMLGIAQPSLSYAVAALERELGCELFERLGRGIKVTPAGEALVEPARRTLRSFALAEGAVRGATHAGFGRISIISHTLWAVETLVQVIGEFRQLYPAVQLTVADPVKRAEVAQRVRSGEMDFGLLEGSPPGGALASHWLVDHELVAVLPPRTLTHLMSASITDLAGAGLISTPVGTELRSMVDKQLELAGMPAEVAVETAHLATVVPLVLAGAGVALLPEGMAVEAAAKGARVLRLAPPRRAAVHIIWREGKLTAPTEHFLDVVLELCKDAQPSGDR
jgi:LysR family transcriptional regulator, carnitine catabolism transcriptional activator